MSKLLLASIIFIFAFALLFAFTEHQKHITNVNAQQSISLEVSAAIGDYHFSLFGYTSPFALVTLEGLGIYDQTYADSKGYFSFANRWSPFSPREACLTAQDQLGRTSSPLCLPPFPTKHDVNIGPVLLPPTVSVDKNNYYIGDQVILSGQTVPDTNVNISVFTQKSCAVVKFARTGSHPYFTSFIARLSSLLVPPVQGCDFPQVTTLADNQGNFSMTIPSQQKDTYKLFGRTDFEQSFSAKSTTLNVEIQPLWMIIIQFFLWLFTLIRPRLLEILICLELIGIGIYFLRKHFHPHIIVRQKSLALRPSLLPELLPEEALMLRN